MKNNNKTGIRNLQARLASLGAFCLTLLLFGCNSVELKVTPHPSDLAYAHLPNSWDEGLPLGNAFVGELIWQKSDTLRFSLDRIDLWDLHPCDSLSGSNFTYKWIYDRWKTGNYQQVHDKMDVPYDREAVPTKLPGAALEFNTTDLGKVVSSRLFLQEAVAEVTWENGAKLQTFVDATQPTGWFVFTQVPKGFKPQLIPPRYQIDDENLKGDPVGGHDLRRLGYNQGKVIENGQTLTYHQKAYGDFYYDVVVTYEQKGADLIGTWSITSTLSDSKGDLSAAVHTEKALKKGLQSAYQSHLQWWNNYWAASSVQLPDSLLQKQYDNEMYKFGCLARSNGYIIPLQGVWTADNGLLPPWKGDVHHDLNTQLSYWPAYKGNHLDEGMGYLNTLWDQKETNKNYTENFFECEGLAVPGVATLLGEPMGGWIQYSLSPTVSGWLAQHFYLHWRYSMDDTFLREKGYPYVKDVATLFENITVINEDGERTLLISSSPEVYDNSPKAWFPTITNYDLAILKNTFQSAEIMAAALGEDQEAAHWATLLQELPDWDLDSEYGLTFAKGKPYDESHRHFSNAMAVHPFSLVDVTDGGVNEKIVRETIKKLDDVGPDYWTGYSYSWLGNMKARALDGEGAAEALRIFAECFCLPNTFHVNGDQSKSGKSKFTYRPFTLEGNMAFASAIQEMLLQSHTDVVRLFPAIPADWKDVSFKNLLAEGAFDISAQRKNGRTITVDIMPLAGGTLRLQNPFGSQPFDVKGCTNYKLIDNNLVLNTEKGKPIRLFIAKD